MSQRIGVGRLWTGAPLARAGAVYNRAPIPSGTEPREGRNVMQLIDLGRVAYEAHARCTTEDLPQWECLSLGERLTWSHVASLVVRGHRDNVRTRREAST